MGEDRVLGVQLGALADLAGSPVAALYSPAGSRLTLRAQRNLDQAAIDHVELAWLTQRRELERGGLVRLGPAVAWPLLNGRHELVAIVFLSSAPAGFPDDVDQQNGAIIVRRVGQGRTPTAVGPQLAEAYGRDERERLVATLRLTAGNVAAAARILGVVRDTIYYRLERFGLTVADFRPGRGRA